MLRSTKTFFSATIETFIDASALRPVANYYLLIAANCYLLIANCFHAQTLSAHHRCRSSPRPLYQVADHTNDSPLHQRGSRAWIFPFDPSRKHLRCIQPLCRFSGALGRAFVGLVLTHGGCCYLPFFLVDETDPQPHLRLFLPSLSGC